MSRKRCSGSVGDGSKSKCSQNTRANEGIPEQSCPKPFALLAMIHGQAGEEDYGNGVPGEALPDPLLRFFAFNARLSGRNKATNQGRAANQGVGKGLASQAARRRFPLHSSPHKKTSAAQIIPSCLLLFRNWRYEGVRSL